MRIANNKAKCGFRRLISLGLIAVGTVSLAAGTGCDELGYGGWDYGYYDAWPDTQTLLDANAYMQDTYDYTNSLWSDYIRG